MIEKEHDMQKFFWPSGATCLQPVQQQTVIFTTSKKTIFATLPTNSRSNAHRRDEALNIKPMRRSDVVIVPTVASPENNVLDSMADSGCKPISPHDLIAYLVANGYDGIQPAPDIGNVFTNLAADDTNPNFDEFTRRANWPKSSMKRQAANEANHSNSFSTKSSGTARAPAHWLKNVLNS